MKSPAAGAPLVLLRSLPVRGAWVEMEVFLMPAVASVSLPVRGAWVEISPATRP